MIALVSKLTRPGYCRRSIVLVTTLSWLAYGLAPAHAFGSPTSESRRTFVFRFDDYPAAEALEVQRQVIALFCRKQIPLTVAVVPANLQGHPEAAPFLKQASDRGCEIALHGWDHSNRLEDVAPPLKSEFMGMPVEEQYARILRGSRLLKHTVGIEAYTFVPPWNCYDEASVEALERAGIKCISASVRPERIHHRELLCLPVTCSIADLLREEYLDGGLYVVLFHAYDFIESKDSRAHVSLPDFGAFLTRLASDSETQFHSIASITRRSPEAFNAARLAAAENVAAFASDPAVNLFAFPEHWFHPPAPIAYEEVARYEQLLRQAHQAAANLNVLTVLTSFAYAGGVFTLVRKLPRRWYSVKLLRLLVAAGSVLSIGLILVPNRINPHFGGFGYKDRIALALIIMTGIGAILGMISRKHIVQEHGQETRP